MAERRADTESVEAPGVDRGRSRDLEAGAVLGCRFEIVALVGRGGSSVVYEAVDRKLRTTVALKILRADRINETSIRRLQREVAIARDVRDERVVRIWDVGDGPEGPYLSMELIRGESLREWIGREPLRIVEDGVRIGLEILGALESLHEIGIIHRDLKPSNVLLDAEGSVHLVDFGLARHWESNESRATSTDAIVGTFEYVSPEQALGRKLDPRSDLYSFGVLLYEALTGRLPFERGSTFGTVLAHVKDRAPDVRRVRPDTPRWLARVIQRLLEKNPDDRYPSASAVAAELRSGRASFRLRRRTLVAAAGAILLAGGAWIGWSASRPEFDRLVFGPSDVRAVDQDGATLWTVKAETTLHATPIRAHGRAAGVLIAPKSSYSYSVAETHTLQLVEPDSGSAVREIRLPSAAMAFSEFTPEFGVSGIEPVDVDDDGTEEAVVVYTHRYWPCYAFLVDPFSGRYRPVLFASGLHRFVAAVDVDGNGTKDLLFAGVNNRMGWYTSLLAIDVGSFGTEDPSMRTAVSTPDADRSGNQNLLLWYSLLPQGWVVPEQSEIDSVRRLIRLRMDNGDEVLVDFDGFAIAANSALPRDERIAKRADAFELARRAQRLLAPGHWSEAVDEAARAAELARSAGVPALAEWMERVAGTARIRSGDHSGGQSYSEELLSRAAAAADVAWDTARALHLEGEYRAAAAWYERGLLRLGRRGRLLADHVEGAVAAYGSLGEWESAERLLSSTISQNPLLGDSLAAFHGFVRLGAGRPLVPVPEPRSDQADFHRVVYLETKAKLEAPSDALLQEILEHELQTSELLPLVRSLRADVLRRLGRTGEALGLARLAVDDATIRSEQDPILAHFLPLVRDRWNAASQDHARRSP